MSRIYEQRVFPILFILDFNECALSTTCDVNAQCTNLPSAFSFQCKCNEGYEGNGFTCNRIATKETVTETECKAFYLKLIFCPRIGLLDLLSSRVFIGRVFSWVCTLVGYFFVSWVKTFILWVKTFFPWVEIFFSRVKYFF